MGNTQDGRSPLWDDLAQVEAKLQTEEGQLEVLTELVADNRPRPFALCAVAPDLTDAGVVAYGLVLPDRVVIYQPEAEYAVRYPSVERVMTFYSDHGTNLRLVWADTPPSEE